jgi:hypothetical protein
MACWWALCSGTACCCCTPAQQSKSYDAARDMHCMLTRPTYCVYCRRLQTALLRFRPAVLTLVLLLLLGPVSQCCCRCCVCCRHLRTALLRFRPVVLTLLLLLAPGPCVSVLLSLLLVLQAAADRAAALQPSRAGRAASPMTNNAC